jgi:quinol monooxygenase YgiN
MWLRTNPADVTGSESENVMSVMMIRAKLKAESVSDVEAAAEKMFSAIDAARPGGVKYASMRLADGVSAVVFLALEDPADNQLEAIPEFREFQEQLPEWLAEPPIVEPLTVIGSYELF